ncbi:Ornithine cyclodeaminase [hydrothermal vent metagenome]|uniref:Ornithine cyclodeaminase n=1 Tax=hydrothermal vent metagenome TaxID=652676 RepID=A0A3B0Y185_9ZZZZ
MLLLDTHDIKSLIQNIGLKTFFLKLIKQLEIDFSHWNDFDKSPRHAIHYNHGVIELMPCSNQQHYSFKYVNGHPGNTKNGKLCVVAMGLLADVKSGYPLMISEMTLLTAIRTAAVAALGAQYLARKNATKLAIIGCGAQSEFQAMAMQSIFPIEEIKVYDIDNNAMDKFKSNLSENIKSISKSKSITECVSEADIIITATASNKKASLFTESDIKPGTHIHAMGGDGPGKTEINIELLKNSKLTVEFTEQTLVEGEIQQLDKSYIDAELWQIINNIKPGRENDTETTIFDSVGFAIEDFSTLNLVYTLSQELNTGSKIELIPKIDNPKDLYGFLDLK